MTPVHLRKSDVGVSRYTYENENTAPKQGCHIKCGRSRMGTRCKLNQQGNHMKLQSVTQAQQSMQ